MEGRFYNKLSGIKCTLKNNQSNFYSTYGGKPMTFKPIISILSLLLFIITSSCCAQEIPLNLDLERIDNYTRNFPGLIKWGKGYDIEPDTTEKHSGKYSLRIEPSVDTEQKLFGCGVFRIPADKQGSSIELRGYMRLENVSGTAGLFMRIDGSAGTKNMDNMMNRGITGTSDWRQYSLSLPLTDDDKNIYFGAMLTGNGKLWIDDFQILIDGKNISEAKTKVQKNYKAFNDTEFDNGSGITPDNLNESAYHNLVLLGKMWGFLKYYHPAISKGDLNWDYELFRVLPKILNVKTKEQRNSLLVEWIESLGEIKEKNEPAVVDISKIKFNADLKWTEDEPEFGSALVDRFTQIKSAKRDSKSFYAELTPMVGNPKFSNESPYANMSFPDAGFRLLSLYRYWNIIQYFFPYKNLIKDDWHKVLENYLPEFIKAQDALEYRLVTLKLIGKIDDTHANIWGNDTILSNYKGIRTLPVKLSFIQNKPVITDVYTQIDPALLLKPGDVIEKINDEDVMDIINKKIPYYPASNYSAKLRNFAKDMLRTNDKFLSITYNRAGETNSSRISSVDMTLLTDPGLDNKKSFKRISDIAYLYPGKLKAGELSEILKRLDSCKGLVIDMRCYPSEFIVFSLGQYLMPSATEFVKFTGTDLQSPGTFHYTDPLNVGCENINYYKGKVIIIVNETTVSQAEYTTMAFRKAPGAVVIGSTTAGADGNVSSFHLPGGILTMISGIGVYYPDGTETQGIGIVPDIEIKPTIKGIEEVRDELLEKAIEIINTQSNPEKSSI